jgi:nuclear transport factor 2 (NTF2) superfamily protein
VPSAQVHVIDGGHFYLDTAANEIASRVREFMDMPKESVQGEEIMATATTPARPPFPPFIRVSAIQKVRLAEDAWNARDPAKVALAYAIDSRWRNRSEFVTGRNEIVAFLSRKWAKELDYRLIKEMWAFTGNRIAVRFAYEWHDDSGHWYRSYGNENWEFSEDGLVSVMSFVYEVRELHLIRRAVFQENSRRYPRNAAPLE